MPMVISRGPGWVVIGATLVVVDVVVVDVTVVDVVVDVSGAIEASTPTRLESFEFCSSLHANKKLTLSSGKRKFDFTYSITEYDTTCDVTIQRLSQAPWPRSP